MLWKCCTQYATNLDNSAVATGLEKVNFHSNPKKDNAKECWNYHNPTVLVSHATTVMLKILQARIQQYMNCELPEVKAGFRKAEEPEIKLLTFFGSWRNQRNSRKNIYFCFIDYAKAFDSVYHNKLWNIFKEMRIPDYLTSLLWKLYAGQEVTVRTRHGTMDWFQIGKGVHQDCTLSPCLFNLYALYVM